jgi:ABC-type nitrate/sulfonate/bicarbonate transport system substrate-binding protein
MDADAGGICFLFVTTSRAGAPGKGRLAPNERQEGMNILRRSAAAIVGAMARASLLALAGGAAAQPLREDSIALGSMGFGTAVVPIAQQLRLFEKHGLKPGTVVMDSGAAASTALLSRSVEIALSGGASTAAAVGAKPRITYMAPPAMASALAAGAVQGIIADAPPWAPPVVNGTGVVWISGLKHLFPAEAMPVNKGSLQAFANFAKTHSDLMRRLAAVVADVVAAVRERPAEVKAAVAKIYPALDPAMLDLLFTSESKA